MTSKVEEQEAEEAEEEVEEEEEVPAAAAGLSRCSLMERAGQRAWSAIGPSTEASRE